MKVKEFLDVVTWNIIDYAKIYEMRWDEDYQDYDCKFIDKRVKSKEDLEPYYDCELDYFDYETQWGEYDDSAIYIKMPKEQFDEEENNMIYMVTAMRDIYEANGVEVAGVFDTEEKAYKAKAKVVEWMEENEYKDYEVFVSPMDVNRIKWYEVEEDI